MTDPILVRHDGPIATVVLNRPQKLNALTKAMWVALGEVFAALSAEEEVRCIVLRGAGERAFSPGNDIGEFERTRNTVDKARAYGAVMQHTLETLAGCQHPVVALIQGVCVGGGLELASLCDLRLCGTSSRFGIPVNRLGLVMSLPELKGLLNLVGRATTLEILLEGRVFDGEEAREKGLVHRVVPDDRVEEEAYATARRISQGAPLAARWHKRFINRLADPAPLTEEEIDEGYLCYGTEDFHIGYQAFLNKIPPTFTGH